MRRTRGTGVLLKSRNNEKHHINSDCAKILGSLRFRASYNVGGLAAPPTSSQRWSRRVNKPQIIYYETR